MLRKSCRQAVIAQLDAGKVDNVRALGEQLSVSVEQEQIEGVNVYHVTPAEVDPRHENHMFVYVHGGAFVLNGGEAGLAEPIVIAHRAKMRVLSIDYRSHADYIAVMNSPESLHAFAELNAFLLKHPQ